MRLETQGCTITPFIQYNNPQGIDRSAAESDRTMFEGRGRSSFFRTYEEEKNTRGAAGTRFPSREGNDGLSMPFPRFAWADTSTGL